LLVDHLEGVAKGVGRSMPLAFANECRFYDEAMHPLC
jgi:hypothetical protein